MLRSSQHSHGMANAARSGKPTRLTQKRRGSARGSASSRIAQRRWRLSRRLRELVARSAKPRMRSAGAGSRWACCPVPAQSRPHALRSSACAPPRPPAPHQALALSVGEGQPQARAPCPRGGRGQAPAPLWGRRPFGAPFVTPNTGGFSVRNYCFSVKSGRPRCCSILAHVQYRRILTCRLQHHHPTYRVVKS